MRKTNRPLILAAALPAAFTAFKDVPCRFRAKSAKGRGEIDIFGVIGADWFGEGITGKMVDKAIKAMGDVSAIDVRIKSPGGDVFEGRAIYNLLAEHKATINVNVIAEAASAASLIAMAGDEITMAEGSLMMIHRASGLAWGNVGDVEKFLNLLKTVDDTLVKTYAKRTGNSEADVLAWLDAETWMDAADAVKMKFADKATAAPEKMAALSINRSLLGFKHIPESLRPNRARALKLIAGGK